jgi:hypothetical protein
VRLRLEINSGSDLVGFFCAGYDIRVPKSQPFHLALDRLPICCPTREGNAFAASKAGRNSWSANGVV